MRKTIKNIFTAIATLAFILSQSSAVLAIDNNPFAIEAFGTDTIAGYTTRIYSSKTLPNKTVIFTVKKPNGNTLTIPAQSKDDGIAEFDLYDYHTKKAGTYSIWAKLKNGTNANGKLNTFYVFPDEVSEISSKIESSKLVGTANGIDKIYFTVELKDKLGNPIKSHEVRVVSSRAEDAIQLISETQFTDSDGKILFSVASSKKGVSVYSFLDTTSNKVLKKRIEIAYDTIPNAGGDTPTAYAATGEVEKFIFENLPASISTNADTNFTLSAVDAEGNVVLNYSGTVHFSAEGTNSVYASLPNDYTFDVDLDTGSHNFSGLQTLNFAQEGIYNIVATDLSDFTIRGDTELTVGASSTQHSTDNQKQPDSSSNNDLKITSPTSGTYSSNELVINGTAPLAGATIQIFDNGTNIGSSEVESDNTFSYTPSATIDGPHEFHVTMQDSDGTNLKTSDKINITIDTIPPKVEKVEFSPSSNIKAGDVINVVVTSEENVFQGAVVFNIDIAELKKDAKNPTKYSASIQAPDKPGTYPIDIILVDELGNEGSYENVTTLEVGKNGEGNLSKTNKTITPDKDNLPTENQAPSDVFGVKATSSDSKITLSWQASTDDSTIVKYKIHYGLTPANLNQTIETFNNKTTWYIPNLTNGNEYFFSLTAIDNNGVESDNMSSIISAIPFGSASVFVPPEKPVTNVISHQVAPKLQSSGPEELWFVLLSLGITQLYFKFKKKMC